MSLQGPVALIIACLCALSYTIQGQNNVAYQQVMEMAMKPRVEGEDQEDTKKAVIELVMFHYHGALGRRYSIGSTTGLFGKRKRRFASFGGGWGSGWDTGYNSGWGSSGGGGYGGYNNNRGYRNNIWSSDPWRNDYGGGYNNHPSNNNYNNNNNNNYNNNNNNNYGSGSHFKTYTNPQNSQIINCPVQSNQSAVYQLNATGDGYPAFVTANMTCPSEDLILFSYIYQNTAFGGRCWIVQGFQEIINFSICLTRGCVNCKLEGHERSSGYQEWNNNQYHPNDYNNPYNQNNNVTVNQCFVEYRTVQVVSYCENLPLNQRIVYDRIIVPLYCTCKSIDCMRRTQHHY